MAESVQRRLGTADAVVLGLAAMLGTGVFAVWGPAAAAAGPWLLVAVLLAAVVATCNAASTTDLAAAHPGCDDGFGFGRERLTPAAGRLAGVAFLVGRTAAAAAAAGVFGAYVLPTHATAAGVVLVVGVTALNVAGVRWTSRGAYALVGGMLVVLAVVAAVGMLGSPEQAAVASPALDVAERVQGGPLGLFTAAGLVFFAFSGYIRVATLGGRLRDPARTLRRAVEIALVTVLVTYLLVGTALLVGLGVDRLAQETAPLVTLVDAGSSALGVLVRVGAAVATGSALLAVLAGASRTAGSMARRGELPAALAATGRRGTPWRADLAGGALAVVVTLAAGPAAAIALSSCAVLVHYAVVNVAALRLDPATRRWPAWTSWVGLLLSLAVAALLPPLQVAVTAVALAAGCALCTVLSRRRMG